MADNTASDCANKRAEGLCVSFILGVVYGNFCGKNGNNINGFSFLFGIQLIGLINIGGMIISAIGALRRAYSR